MTFLPSATRRLDCAALISPLLFLAACVGDQHGQGSASRGSSATGGTLIVATGQAPVHLLPPIVSTLTDLEISSVMFDRLADPGDGLNVRGDSGFRGVLAQRWSWSPDSLSIAFSIDPRARWHDGAPVTAADVKYTWAVNMDPATAASAATLLANIDSVSVRDSLTPVFWFKHRSLEQFYDATYQMRIIPQHVYGKIPNGQLANAPEARTPVGSGRFRFAKWVPGSQLELVADTANFRGRPGLDRAVWSVTPDAAAAGLRVLAGDADLDDYVLPAQTAEFAKHPEIRVVRQNVPQVVVLYFNERDPTHLAAPHPLFADRELRRALAMAIDRSRIVQSVLGDLGHPAIGPASRAVLGADTIIAQVPYAPDSARAILDRLGWRVTPAHGVRVKQGRPLRFTLALPASSNTRMNAALLVQAALKDVGADVQIDAPDPNAYNDHMRHRTFDAALETTLNDPAPSSVRQSWSSAAAKQAQTSNYGSYQSAAFDALVDSAIATLDPARSRVLYARAYAQLIADVPAIFMYEPVQRIGIHKRFRTAPMRPDGWWIHLADWTVPAGERIGRDSVGLVALTR